jgi:hypothetical protein
MLYGDGERPSSTSRSAILRIPSTSMEEKVMQVGDTKIPTNAKEARTYVWRIVNALSKAHVDALKELITVSGNAIEQSRVERELDEIHRAMMGMVAIEVYLVNREAKDLKEEEPL